jgi:multiple antibiotic resistance protein
LRANYQETPVLIAILINLVIIYLVLKSLDYIARFLGPSGLIAIRKFFGVVLLAIAVKIFATNASGLDKVSQKSKVENSKNRLLFLNFYF